MRYNYTVEDILFLKENYPNGNWDKIHKKFPTLSNVAIYRKMQKLGVKSNNKHWENFNNSDLRNSWNKDEIEILIKNYSSLPIDAICDLLPNRSKNSIIGYAKRANLISYGVIHNKWNNNEIQYVADNWELVPDKLMADELGRSFRAVKAKREEIK